MAVCDEESRPLIAEEAKNVDHDQHSSSTFGHHHYPRPQTLSIFLFCLFQALLYVTGVFTWQSVSFCGLVALYENAMLALPRYYKTQKSPLPMPRPPPKVLSQKGFASYLDYANAAQPINVSYDGRSFLLNSERTIFLSGSMHPVRMTEATWSLALNDAVNNGLNMITVYIMWSAHQPFQHKPINWTLPMNSLNCRDSDDTDECDWTLARALWAAADRGLFVHLRLGPYVCAEYSYGGIPEWLPLQFPDMDMRRLDSQWMKAMHSFLDKAISYMKANQLFGYQGGPVLMAQIENELGDDGILDGGRSPYGSLQQYADWSGKVAQELEPNVVWTMCNGLSANSTISTFNGDVGAPYWLESRGETGRIQIDQPAMWTEDEGGFQIWGEEPSKPTDYYWGRTARSMTYTALQWFARGGSHLNYYMFAGGQNFGRMAAAGITTNYASDAVLCSSGQRHEPKFSHLRDMHANIAAIAHVLVDCDSALFRNISLSVLSPSGFWKQGTDQQMFRYQAHELATEVIFTENNADYAVTVLVPDTAAGNVTIFMGPFSASLLVDGVATFDSSLIQPTALNFTRTIQAIAHTPRCSSQAEPIGASALSNRTLVADRPFEQTFLVANASLASDYTWYETTLAITDGLSSVTLHLETSQANAMIVYLDDQFVGASDTHNHKEGGATLNVFIGDLVPGELKLSILSESLGYGNLLGRWGASTRSKTKGITGNVWLTSPSLTMLNKSLVDGREWRSYPGLHGEHLEFGTDDAGSGDSWSSAQFVTPLYDASSAGLFVEMTLGRGHLFLNGKDLGRIWNITRGSNSEPSQRYYFLPPDLLAANGELNELKWFDAFGSSCEGYRIVLSWIAHGDGGFEDEVAYDGACI